MSLQSAVVLVVDGARGTGKTRVAAFLRSHGYEVVDGGLLSEAIRSGDLGLAHLRPREGEYYFVLDSTPDACMDRLLARSDLLVSDLPTLQEIERELLDYRVVMAALPRDMVHCFDTTLGTERLERLLIARSCSAALSCRSRLFCQRR